MTGSCCQLAPLADWRPRGAVTGDVPVILVFRQLQANQ
jgi:hypothetical protein